MLPFECVQEQGTICDFLSKSADKMYFGPCITLDHINDGVKKHLFRDLTHTPLYELWHKPHLYFLHLLFSIISAIKMSIVQNFCRFVINVQIGAKDNLYLLLFNYLIIFYFFFLFSVEHIVAIIC